MKRFFKFMVIFSIIIIVFSSVLVVRPILKYCEYYPIRAHVVYPFLNNSSVEIIEKLSESPNMTFNYLDNDTFLILILNITIPQTILIRINATIYFEQHSHHGPDIQIKYIPPNDMHKTAYTVKEIDDWKRDAYFNYYKDKKYIEQFIDIFNTYFNSIFNITPLEIRIWGGPAWTM